MPGRPDGLVGSSSLLKTHEGDLVWEFVNSYVCEGQVQQSNTLTGPWGTALFRDNPHWPQRKIKTPTAVAILLAKRHSSPPRDVLYLNGPAQEGYEDAGSIFDSAQRCESSVAAAEAANDFGRAGLP